MTAGALDFVADLQRRFGARRDELLGRTRAPPGGDAPHRPARLPARHTADPRGGLDRGAGTGRPPRPAGGDHRAARAEDGDQRAELRREGVAGRSGGREHPALVATSSAASSSCATPSAGSSNSPRPRARHYRLAHGPRRSRSSSRAPAAGTSTSGTCWSTARRPSARLVDFGLYFFHNAAELLNRGSGPYFYLPKMESHLEARLWNDVFTFAAGSDSASRTAPSAPRC